MTKKHFEDIAVAINSIMDPHSRLQAAIALASVAIKHNPRFDSQRFFKACGVTSTQDAA
jgi:hypothetical protein